MRTDQHAAHVAVAGHGAGVGWSLGLLVVSVAFAVVAQVMLKAGMNAVGRIGIGGLSAPRAVVMAVATEPRIWAGLALYGVSALFWLVVLSRIPLSVAYPFVGMSYIVVVASARLFLGEHVPLLRWVGVAVVAAGIVLVGLSFRRLTG